VAVALLDVLQGVEATRACAALRTLVIQDLGAGRRVEYCDDRVDRVDGLERLGHDE
jgi:hypothetical protein